MNDLNAQHKLKKQYWYFGVLPLVSVYIIGIFAASYNLSRTVDDCFISQSCSELANKIAFFSSNIVFFIMLFLTTYTLWNGYRVFKLSQNDFHKLYEFSNNRNIKFLSTAFDLSSVLFLKKLNLDYFKIPSGEITNLPYLRLIGSFNLPILLSTGMSSLSDIENAIEVIESCGTDRKKITLLHCTTEYPAPFNEINLNVIRSRIWIYFGLSLVSSKFHYSDF